MDINTVEISDKSVNRVVWAMVVRVAFRVVGEAVAVALVNSFVESPMIK